MYRGEKQGIPTGMVQKLEIVDFPAMRPGGNSHLPFNFLTRPGLPSRLRSKRNSRSRRRRTVWCPLVTPWARVRCLPKGPEVRGPENLV